MRRGVGWPLALIALATVAVMVGCHARDEAPEGPMPAHTILFSQMMRELSERPGFTDALLAHLNEGGKKGPALLTPTLFDALRKIILGKNWQGLDRFPGWDARNLTRSVALVDRIAGANAARNFLDVGPYALEREQTVSLDAPSALPGFTTDGIVKDLGADVTQGDGANDLASEHAESQRLADVLNRLAANALEGSAHFTVELGGRTATKPEDLMGLLDAAGETMEIDDARYFANFGHLHFRGQDVMMPFWLDTGYQVPGTGGFLRASRRLLVPVAHAELELHVRRGNSGAGVDADVSYYFGVDGKSEWRTMDTLDQAWVLKRNAHEYRGAQEREAVQLSTALTIAYMHEHRTRPNLPFGGYYALGVCQDGVAAIEKKLTGRTTLFPNTADAALFTDPRDAEVNALMRAIPNDRKGVRPQPERIFGSIPTTDFSRIAIPGLAGDLRTADAAWQAGKLR